MAVEQDLRKAETTKAVALAQKEKEHEEARAEADARHQQDLQKLNADYEAKIDDLRKKERVKFAQAYEQFSSILDGDRKTLDYINLIEQKMKSGGEYGRAGCNCRGGAWSGGNRRRPS